MESNNEEFQKYLDDSNYHLTDETISNFISLHEIFNESETEFIDNHIKGCPLCLEKYNSFFDQNFLDDETIDLTLLHHVKEELDENEKMFVNDESTIKLVLKKEDEFYSIIFLHIVPALAGKKLKITLPDLKIIFRIRSVKQNTVYKVDRTDENETLIAKSILIESLKEAEQFVIPVQTEKSFPLKNIILVAGVVIVAVIFIIMLTRNGSDDSDSESNLLIQDTEEPFPEDPNPAVVEEDTVEAAGIQDTAAVVKPEEVSIANNFSENYVLEDRIRELESDLRMQSPSFNESVSLPINFRWSDMSRSSGYSLIIVDNKNSKKYESNIVGNSITYSGSIKPGVYYWKIEVNGELKGMSKFIYR